MRYATCGIGLNVVCGLIFIIGGATDHFVWGGTNDGTRFVYFGIALIFVGIMQIVESKDDNDK